MELLSAIQLQPFERVKKIFDSMEILSNSENIDYQALNLALELSRKRTASYLIKMNCRVNKEETSKHENTPLHHAVEMGDCQIVGDLLTRKASVVAVNHKGDSPLHLAFLRRHNDVVELILNFIFAQKLFDVNIKNLQGLTHMHIACTVDNERLVQLFLNAGANVEDAVSKDSPYCSDYTAMHFAIENKCIEVSKLLLNASKFMIDPHGYVFNNRLPFRLAFENLKDFQILFYQLSGQNQKYDDIGFHDFLTQFHMACLGEYPEVVRDFISHGAAINAPLSSNANLCPEYTPLHCAVESNCKENVALLIKNGAKVMRMNGNYMTPLHLALYNEDPTKKDTIVDLLYAVTEDRCEKVTDFNGLSYMHVAVTRNDIASVKLFLKKDKRNVHWKVLYNIRKFSGFSPLHFAVRHRHLEMAELLVKHGADVNCNDGLLEGTPLHLACKAGYKQLIEFLLEKGARADINRTWDNKTMIYLLVESYINQLGDESLDADGNVCSYHKDLEDEEGLLDCVELLVKKKCDINAITKVNGNTALHLACDKFWDGAPCVPKLLEFGADINIENSASKTPFQLALKEIYCNNDADYAVLYYHVQKLKALGYYVNPKNEIRCEKIKKKRYDWGDKEWECPLDEKDYFSDEELEQKHQQRLEEIAKMKNLKLDENISLYDFMHLETKLASAYVCEKPLVKLFKNAKELKKQFPSYAYLIKLRYDQAVDYIIPNEPSEKESHAGVVTRSRSGTKRSREE